MIYSLRAFNIRYGWYGYKIMRLFENIAVTASL